MGAIFSRKEQLAHLMPDTVDKPRRKSSGQAIGKR
jgi:hypothetical protein